jgi:hypothetical protein
MRLAFLVNRNSVCDFGANGTDSCLDAHHMYSLLARSTLVNYLYIGSTEGQFIAVISIYKKRHPDSTADLSGPNHAEWLLRIESRRVVGIERGHELRLDVFEANFSLADSSLVDSQIVGYIMDTKPKV